MKITVRTTTRGKYNVFCSCGFTRVGIETWAEVLRTEHGHTGVHKAKRARAIRNTLTGAGLLVVLALVAWVLVAWFS